ncbi:MAG TPA: tetratricopeptide repeat protein [Rhodothermales bacterium]|nr:tetratricopeptide repeat protein [Rhodothermales bacterium]
MSYCLAILLLLLLAGDPPDGRKGNELYRQGRYAEAAEAYRAGLSALGEGASTARYGLLNNLGSALYRSEQFGDAREAFDQAMAGAQTETDRSRAAYNAGNAAFSAGALQDAVSYYEQALLDDPANDNARFNYEFARRKLKEQQQQKQQQSGQQKGNGKNDDQQNGKQNDPKQGKDRQQNNGSPNQQDEGRQDQQKQPPDRGGNQQQDQQPSTEPPQQNGEAQAQDQDKLSREQAERILQAMQNGEEQQLRRTQKMKAPPRHVEKDW